MATFNLTTKYASKIAERFHAKSRTRGRFSDKYKFVGAKTIRVYSLNPVPMNDYTMSRNYNRYGDPTDVSDTIQEMTVTQQRSFSAILDKTVSVDQCIEKAGAFLRIQTDEAVVPMMDTYVFKSIADKAGCIVGTGTAITEDNVVKRMNAARTHMANKNVTGTLTWYISATVYGMLLENKWFMSLEKLGNKAIATGHVGQIFGHPCIEIPDDMMPKGVNFMLVCKDAVLAHIKIDDVKVHQDPPGIHGELVEGVYYYDAFVLGAKADGVYVDVTTGEVTVAAAPTVGTDGKITVASGMTCKYTVDGSDPRYSANAVTITATTGSAVATSGAMVKAYQYKAGGYASPVAHNVVA
jgi:hypothetical protein